MKIKFTKLPTNDGTIKVSLDGGQSFTDYNIADIHESGIPLEDSQDYEKIQVKAPANVLKNLDIVASVKIESNEGGGTGGGSTNESGFIIDTDTYGFHFPSCVAGIIIPNGATTIGKNVFSTYPNLQTVVIPESVTSIGREAFAGCSRLTSVTIPNSVTSIGNGAFSSCKGLTSITIPNSVTSIDGAAFSGCTSLTSVTIPSSVTSIGGSAFMECSGLTSINIPEGVTSIGDYTFGNCSSLTSITIPDSVTSIGNGAFSSCKGLTSITIPEGVTSIGGSAFYNCIRLTSINIPNSVTSISREAFQGCTGLTSITIPESVTSISFGAFKNCSSLTSINYTGTEEQWSAISKDDSWNFGCPSDMVIHFAAPKQPSDTESGADEPIPEPVSPKYKAVKDYYITGRNTENTAEPNEDDEIINGWYVPRINLEHMHYKFIGADSINGLGIFAVVADARYFIGGDGFAMMIEDDGVSNEIDYKTGFYIPVSEQTEDSSYVALGNWYVAYENSHIVDGECENGYRLYEDKYAVPDISYTHMYLSKFCELEGVCIFVETVDQRYSIKNGEAVMIEEAEAPNEINYGTGYWKLP